MTVDEIIKREGEMMGRPATLVSLGDAGEMAVAIYDLEPLDTGHGSVMHERRYVLWQVGAHVHASGILSSRFERQ